MLRSLAAVFLFGGLASVVNAQEVDATRTSDAVAAAIAKAGDNRAELQRALQKVPDEQRAGMRFLIEHMPDRDLRSLTADFLLRNVQLAYKTREQSGWQIPDDVFFNNVLPYASINESRDDFRQQFFDRFWNVVKDAKSPGEAAAILNNHVFKELNVKYSRRRNRADQGPFESMETGLASCTGLSILLIDACRSVGVPARFVGIPLWSDRSGNHSWVEIWDDGWHFTGAAEPAGMELDKAWFVGRASQAQRDVPRHAIYAVSYRDTPTRFPLVWDRSIDYVHAVNVTDRYANRAKPLPADHLNAMFKVYRGNGERCCVPIKVKDASGKVVFEGETKDESFDGNDHTTVALPIGKTFQVEFASGQSTTIQTEDADSNSQLFAFPVENAETSATSAPPADDTDSELPEEKQTTLRQLQRYLQQTEASWDALPEQAFATLPLSKEDAVAAKRLLVQARREQLLAERQPEHQAGELQWQDRKLPFFFKVYGDKPAGQRSLFISMHGGGNAPSRVNDRQWNNQKRLYQPEEGVYVAPRAPTNTWNLWHEPHIMPMFDRLIENMVLFEGVDPNRVYLMGYSAGGDGVYQLAPRMADRWAAASMMAGHPNDAQPGNLRNIGFALFMGGKDGAYKRNQVAQEWGEKLDRLKAQDPGGYEHKVTIYPDKGHWMDGEDKAAIPWMTQFTRQPFPAKVVWRKDGNPQARFYWLRTSLDEWEKGQRWVAEIDGQQLSVKGVEADDQLDVLLNDEMVDLDQALSVAFGNTAARQVNPARTIAVMHDSLSHRFDPAVVYSAKVSHGSD